MEIIELGKKYFENEEWEKAFIFFNDLRNTGNTTQELYPYLIYTSLKTEQFHKINELISYPFRKKLITDINAFDSQLSIEQWIEIEEIFQERELLATNFTELFIYYFATDIEEKLTYLFQFVPENNEDEFWLNMFIFNSFRTYFTIWRHQVNEPVSIYQQPYSSANKYFEKCVSIYNTYALPYYTEASLATPLPNGWIQYFEYIDKAIDLNPKYKEAYMVRISWYLDEELYNECLVDCGNVINLNISEKERKSIHSIMKECLNSIGDV